jgi:hypothetical protein
MEESKKNIGSIGKVTKFDRLDVNFIRFTIKRDVFIVNWLTPKARLSELTTKFEI